MGRPPPNSTRAYAGSAMRQSRARWYAVFLAPCVTSRFRASLLEKRGAMRSWMVLFNACSTSAGATAFKASMKRPGVKTSTPHCRISVAARWRTLLVTISTYWLQFLFAQVCKVLAQRMQHAGRSGVHVWVPYLCSVYFDRATLRTLAQRQRESTAVALPPVR